MQEVFIEVRWEGLLKGVHILEDALFVVIAYDYAYQLQTTLHHAAQLNKSFEGSAAFLQSPAHPDRALSTVESQVALFIEHIGHLPVNLLNDLRLLITV